MPIAFGEGDNQPQPPAGGHDCLHARRCGPIGRPDASTLEICASHSFSASSLIRGSAAKFMSCRRSEGNRPSLVTGLGIWEGGRTDGVMLTEH